MTVRDALHEGSRRLETGSSDTPYLDALVILTAAAKVAKEQLYAMLNDPLERETVMRFHELVERRAAGEPVAYLTNSKEFFGRQFYVDERVLIPRPDTETLVTEAVRIAKTDHGILRVHDLGTGSGCIALTLKAECPRLNISASDISPEACEVFRINAGRLRLEVELYQAPFFDALQEPVDMVVSNPPYLTDAEAAAMSHRGWPEPQAALRAGPAGLDCIETIVCKSVQYIHGGGHLVLEAAPAQMPMIKGMMLDAGFGGVTVTRDLGGRERVVSGVKNG